MNKKLPEGWEVKKLGEVCKIKPTKNEARARLSDNDLVSFVPMEDLGILTKSFTVTKERLLKEVLGSYTYFANDDVLLAKITPCFENGKIGIARDLKNGVGFGSSEYIVFRSNGTLISDYLYYYLVRDEFRAEGANVMTGAVGHKRVPKEFVENLKIPYPTSLIEQKNIVSILDEAFAAIASAKENAEKNLKNARELFDSYLESVFANPGEGWITCNLGDYIKFIDYRGKTPEKTETGVRLITAKNIKNGFLKRTPEEFIAFDAYDSWMTRGIPKKGDVLFTTEAPLGNVAQLDTDEKVAFAQRVIILQPDEKKIDQTFLKYLLLSDSLRQKILSKGTGATVQGIKASLLKKIPILLTGLPEQKNIVSILDEAFLKTKRLESIYQQKITALDELKKSILEKAFSGELKKKTFQKSFSEELKEALL
ncbi:MAG: restriction endonuclease subunit S [Spirobacillus cienkowskii]|jgi:type I restriction enzyme S subunit|uniref:Restriction endonuclease subunit S n=1 Tax=Spirobacillus cienkowskii TaxID=495820 RepID=A0A369KW37_9BACT|nr:MAG: restriction endonuclease subunit S [Spirobacillus cienkowskii]